MKPAALASLDTGRTLGNVTPYARLPEAQTACFCALFQVAILGTVAHLYTIPGSVCLLVAFSTSLVGSVIEMNLVLLR